MPNLLQLAFILSAVASFAGLYTVTRFLFPSSPVVNSEMAAAQASFSDFLQTPTGLSLLIGGGIIVGTWWLLSVKHTRMHPL